MFATIPARSVSSALIIHNHNDFFRNCDLFLPYTYTAVDVFVFVTFVSCWNSLQMTMNHDDVVMKTMMIEGVLMMTKGGEDNRRSYQQMLWCLVSRLTSYPAISVVSDISEMRCLFWLQICVEHISQWLLGVWSGVKSNFWPKPDLFADYINLKLKP